jgi:N-acetylglutamate synthase-like GNAT family acetyltransferase
MADPTPTFSEREFYLAEFRGRSIGIAWPPGEEVRGEPLAGVLEDLGANGSRVVLLSPNEEVFAVAGIANPLSASDEGFGPLLWNELRTGGRAGLRVGAPGFAEGCRDVALALRLAKLVWIQSEPPVVNRSEGHRVSVVDLAHLDPLLSDAVASVGASSVRPGCEAILEAIREMIEGGIPGVNVCAPVDLGRELFTYAGAGTFFTRDRYAEVRPLGLDDYDLAYDLIERGEVDGYLAPRDAAAREAVLAHGVGVFIEGRYLAGIGAILPYPPERAAEVASLFALTRYVGEGAGGQIVRYAVDDARRQALDYLFACTTSDRVASFFERHGFGRVGPGEVPARKWAAYDADRRDHVCCLRLDLKA